MHIPINAPIHLLHQRGHGTLASHARQPDGYPYPTALPYIVDAHHRPTILISRLAEHTRNLQHDARAGFLVCDAPDDDVLAGQRLTLIGHFAAVATTDTLSRRYLRYHPESERYMALGDFAFYRMEPLRLRYIGGFGAMGWLDASALDALPPLDEADELALIEAFDAVRPAELTLLGVDRYGADLSAAGARVRMAFDTDTPDDLDALREKLVACAARVG